MPTFFVAELHPGCFMQPAQLVPPKTEGWRFFAHCEEDDFETCSLIYKDFLGMSGRTRKDFITLWAYLFEAAKAGKPWQTIFSDGKLFHPVHEFTVTRVIEGKDIQQKCEVHQFKKRRTDVRVLFVYTGKQLVIFVTHAFEKDSDRTPHSEQARAEATAKQFLAALDEGRVRLITEQVDENAGPRIF